jgi:ribosomal protein L40E
MKCPSCHHENAEPLNFCGRCRMSFNPLSFAVARGKGHLYWILRRACAGGMSGVIAWFFIPIVGRLLSQQGAVNAIYPLTGLMGGAFLGAVDGMVEESTPKTARGTIVGGLGGLLGGILFQLFMDGAGPTAVSGLIFLYWAVTGAFIGTVSAWWEKQNRKIAAGVVSGFLGGGIGAYIGTSLHAYIIQSLTIDSWWVRRSSEAAMGGIIGLTLWFSIAAAERFIIFKRRLAEKQDHKTCDRCQARNPLSSWYCASCGSVLQQSAPSEKLHFPRSTTLLQLSEMLRFLSRLSAATGYIAGFVSLLIFVPNFSGLEQLMSVIVVLIIALISYGLQILFSSLSEGIQLFIEGRG